ncbi:MAG: ABC transporter ATP-binding protein [Chloroflexi bacterium]|nr:ABC transporter ATP-binding protein [Chloroflexota bacterium]
MPAGDVPAGPAIEVERLRKEYGRKVALHELSLTVPRGEVFGFLGPNGAGKTTAVKLLTGLVRPSSGGGTLLGRPLGDRQTRRRLGFLPELFRFHEWLTASELLHLHGQLLGMDSAQRRTRISEVLDLVGLADRARDRVGTFSKGMQQRLGLGQALLNWPDLVILDEPTSALDPIGRRDVRVLIQRLKDAGLTVFLNSHLLSEVELVCDRVAIVDRGRVVQEGRIEDLLSLGHESELRVTGLTELALSRLRERWEVRETANSPNGLQLTLSVGNETEAAEVARFLVAHSVDLLELRPRKTNLEDVFLQWVQGEEGGRLDLRPAESARSVA